MFLRLDLCYNNNFIIKEESNMKNAKKMLSWLLMFAMVFSLLPGNLVKAEEGENFSLTIHNLPNSGYEILDKNDNPIEINGSSASIPVEENGTVTFKIKSSKEVLDYGISSNAKELPATQINNTTYSYTLSDISSNTVVYFVQKYKIQSDIDIIPCTNDGTPISGYENGVKEFYANDIFYFKSADGLPYKFTLSNKIPVNLNNSGLYSFSMPIANVTMTAERQYIVKTDSYFIDIDSNKYSPVIDKEVEEIKYYTTDNFEFTVTVNNQYNTKKMQVTLTEEDEDTIILEPVNSVIENENYIYTYRTDTLSHDAVIDVTGIYSNDDYHYLFINYDKNTFADVSIKVKDEDGNTPEKEENSYILYEYMNYQLVLSSDTVDLSEIIALADNMEFEFTRQEDGSYVADVTSKSQINLSLGDKKFYIDYVNTDEDNDAYAYPCSFEEDKMLEGFYAGGELKFWINCEDYGYTSEHAAVTEIKDNNDNPVPFEKEENIEVDDAGTRRTVYTVNIDSNITIYFGGIERIKYDVYLPVPSETDGYTISDVKVLDGNNNILETPTGEQNSENTYKKYSNLEYGLTLSFNLTVPSGSAEPLVSGKSSEDGEDYIETLNKESFITNENGSKTYTYRLYIDKTTEIQITTITREIEVVAKDNKGYIEYNELQNCWKIYDQEDEEKRKLLVTLYDLPKIVGKSDINTQYKFYLEFPYDYNPETESDVQAYRIEKGKENSVFVAYNSNNIPTMLLSEDDYYTMPAGHYKLEVDISCIIPYVSYIRLLSEYDNITITPAIKENAGYQELGNNCYIPDTDVFYFTLTAKNPDDFDNIVIDLYKTLYEEYEISEDGLSRTYKLNDTSLDRLIRVACISTFFIKNGTNVSIISDEFDYLEKDNNGKFINIPSGTKLSLNLKVKKGYDADSVKIKHEYKKGNNIMVDTYPVSDGTCDIILYPGDNIFTTTEPVSKKAEFKINLPQNTAYTIEPVNESITTVKYGNSFSFRVKGTSGYDLSNIIISANGQNIKPDKNGIYTISNIKCDYDIVISGYKINTFTVTFKDYNGETIGKPQTVNMGENATAPAAPVRKGYLFTGWDKNFTDVRENLVITAIYEPILVNKITVTGDITKLAAGKSVTLKAAVAPSDALNTEVIWSSSNNKYATVTMNGKVTAKKAGAGKKVTITATAKDGSGIKAAYKISIQKNAVKKIKLSVKSKSVKPGKKVKIKAKISPSKKVNKTLKWSSSNNKYATVNSKGVVTTKKAGKGKTVTITATATDGSNKKAKIKIKIRKK